MTPYDPFTDTRVITASFVAYMLIGFVVTVLQGRREGRIDGRTLTLWPLLIALCVFVAVDRLLNLATFGKRR